MHTIVLVLGMRTGYNKMKLTYATKITLLIFLSFLIIGCKGISPKNSPQNERIAKSFKANHKYSNIYIYTEAFVGPTGAPIFIDGKSIGVLGQSTFLLSKIKPGQHTISCVFPGNTLKEKLHTKANKNYFVAFFNDISGRSKEQLSLKRINSKVGKKKVFNLHMLQTSRDTASHAKQKTNYKATKISPSIYRKYSCSKLESNILSINSQLSGLVEVSDQNKLLGGLGTVAMAGASAGVAHTISNSTRKVDMRSTTSYNPNTGAFKSGSPYTITKTTMVPIPTISSKLDSSSKRISVQISSLLGQYNAMATVAKEKKCAFASKLK